MKNQLLKGKRVAVIGAGPVGLTAARLLQQAGVDVGVYERDADAGTRISGGTLDIHKNTGQKALQKAGLLDGYYRAAKPTGECMADVSGRIVMREFPATENRYDRPEIDRNDLRKLLLRSLEPGTVAWGRQYVSVDEREGRFSIRFEDGTTATADVVVGANGGRSGVRTYVTDMAPQYTGTFIIQGEVTDPGTKCPDYKRLCGDDNLVMPDGEQKMLFSQTRADGAIVYYVAFKGNEHFLSGQGLDINDNRQTAAFLEKLCRRWDVRFKTLFGATDRFSALPMRRMPLDKKWTTQSNITLIGDAAHVMPPFAGIGVNIGLLDALRLSENLTEGNFLSIREAMDDYESRMFEYAGEAQKATSEAEAGFFSDDSIEDRLKGREEWNKTL